MTLEEAQARILELEEENATLKTERESYTNRVTELEKDNQKVRELNQQYFLKLSAQYKPTPAEDDEQEEETPSCEDFARTLSM